MDNKRAALIEKLNSYRSPAARQEYRKKRFKALPNYQLVKIALDPATKRPRTEYKYRLAVEEYERRLKLGIIGSVIETASNAQFETKIEQWPL